MILFSQIAVDCGEDDRIVVHCEDYGLRHTMLPNFYGIALSRKIAHSLRARIVNRVSPCDESESRRQTGMG
jgi:hypothetical protein